ncbi:hypothetical protein BC835DRAFT_359338 [Cytidiella melzeri]|nr:hypothetical protein BC835DRAFT_359338 [Cytidiella melzeri]
MPHTGERGLSYGNIPMSGEGHIAHVGVFDLPSVLAHKSCFQSSSSKLAHEMMVLTGGRYSQGCLSAVQAAYRQGVPSIRSYADQDSTASNGETSRPACERDHGPQAAGWMMSIVTHMALTNMCELGHRTSPKG